MEEKPKPSSAEQLKNFLWFAAIAFLLAVALVLWIRKSTSSKAPVGEEAAGTAQEQRAARLSRELGEILQFALAEEGRPPVSTSAVSQPASQPVNTQRQREALIRLQRMIIEAPDFLPARAALVRFAATLGENELARRTADDMAKDYPDIPMSHVMVALVAERAGDRATAETALKKAIDIGVKAGEESWEAHALLAEVYLKQDRLAEADAELHRAVAVNAPEAAMGIAQTSLELAHRLGIVLSASNQPLHKELAFRLLDGVSRHKKDDADVRYRAAEAAADRGHAEDARRLLAEATKLKPDDPRAGGLTRRIATMPASRPATMPATRPAAPVSAPGQ